MAVTVRVPTPMRKMTDDQQEVQANGDSIGAVLNDLEARYPGFTNRICDDQGELRRFINVYVNDEDIRFLQGKETSLKDGDEISIVPAIAGG
ncbi:MAG: MoaD/ThiS family protein [Armatimonadetes bacterium]|nr:MoaD/ThiS family protein [Armatimonadota bacterium]